ncbi:MAG: DUF4846 domain-containing protein [Chitinophagaceae bacterium]
MHCLLLMILLYTCNSFTHEPSEPDTINKEAGNSNPYVTINAIPLPPGFTRINVPNTSFAAWLRQLPLKKNKTVFTFNGRPKANQAAQFAVIDVSVGDKDLQQCADAIMRLRAEYLYEQKKYAAIDFIDNSHTHYRLAAGASRAVFDQYLNNVFARCGTASLEKQLLGVSDFMQIASGDILIKGGSPGHAMLVMDVAADGSGKKIYLLAQSYMPAQDMHVVINPASSAYSPWYEAGNHGLIETPEWVFKKTNLKKWP